MNDLDQQKAGLQDDHDPRDLGQKQNDRPKGDIELRKPPVERSDRGKRGDNPPDADVTGGAGSQGGM